MTRWSPQPAPDEPDGLVLFDGECVFCSRWVRFVIDRDPERRFRFVALPAGPGRGAGGSFAVSLMSLPPNGVWN